MSVEDALYELRQAHEEALESAREDGYSDGYNEGSRDGDRKLDDFRRAVLEKLAQLRLGAELPLPLNGITMTLEEVEELIREAA